MTVIAIVSETTKVEAVLFEAAERAEELDTDIHVVYLTGLGWMARMEWWIANVLDLGGGLAGFRDIAEQQADTVADPILDDYTAIGLAGNPIEEIVEYANRVDAECIVINGDAKLVSGVTTTLRDPLVSLAGCDFTVVPVY